jgi:hypothetical protein
MLWLPSLIVRRLSLMHPGSETLNLPLPMV